MKVYDIYKEDIQEFSSSITGDTKKTVEEKILNPIREQQLLHNEVPLSQQLVGIAGTFISLYHFAFFLYTFFLLLFGCLLFSHNKCVHVCMYLLVCVFGGR